MIYRKSYHRVINGVIKFQALYRMYKHRQQFLQGRNLDYSRIARRQREHLSHVHIEDKLVNINSDATKQMCSGKKPLKGHYFVQGQQWKQR